MHTFLFNTLFILFFLLMSIHEYNQPKPDPSQVHTLALLWKDFCSKHENTFVAIEDSRITQEEMLQWQTFITILL